MGKLVSKGSGEATRGWMDAIKMLTSSVYGASRESDEFLRMMSSEVFSLESITKDLGVIDPATAVTKAYVPGERTVTKTGIIRTPSGDKMVAAGDSVSALIAKPYEYKSPSELEGLFYGTPTHGKTRDGIHSEESFKKILGRSTSACTGPEDAAFDVEALKRSIGELQDKSLLREPIGVTPKKPEAPKSDVPVDVGEHVGSW